MIFLGSSQNSDLQGNTEVVVESTTPKPKNGDEVIVNKNDIDEKNFVKPQQKSNFDENDIDIAEALLANKEHKDQLNIDVKIGDGMDIAIHGENGKYFMYSFKLGNFIQFVFGSQAQSKTTDYNLQMHEFWHYECMTNTQLHFFSKKKKKKFLFELENS